MVVLKDVRSEDLDKLKLFEEEPKTIYELRRLSGDNVTLVLYSSGKLLIQGKNGEEFAKKLKFGKTVDNNFIEEKGTIIGSDEVLKGDTFGGLIVAGVKANEKVREQLIHLGVKDSKKLKDKEIVLIAKKIKEIAPCEIRSLLPEEYNNYENITMLLNRLHQEIGDYLKPGKHIVDKYPGCNVGDIMTEKAEDKYIEVAAASILARAEGLKQFSYLSKEAGFDLPKGSTHVQEALIKMKEKKLDFKKFVKLNFRNVKEIL
jgi:ribonuclease HIII